MKTFLKIAAWSGMCFFALLVIILFWQSFLIITAEEAGGFLFSPMVALIVSCIGLVPMLAGGLISKPKHFWLICIVVGSLYILSHFYLYLYIPSGIQGGQLDVVLENLAYSVLPGLVAIVEGIWLKRTGGKSMIREES